MKNFYPIMIAAFLLSWIGGQVAEAQEVITMNDSSLSSNNDNVKLQQQYHLSQTQNNDNNNLRQGRFMKEGHASTMMMTAEVPFKIGYVPSKKMNPQEQKMFAKVLERFFIKTLVQSSPELLSVQVTLVDQALEKGEEVENTKSEKLDRSDPSDFISGRLGNDKKSKNDEEKGPSKSNSPPTGSLPLSYLMIDTLVRLEYQPLLVTAPTVYFHEMIPNVIEEHGNDMIAMLHQTTSDDHTEKYFAKVESIEFVSYFLDTDGTNFSLDVKEKRSAASIFLIVFLLLIIVGILGLLIVTLTVRHRQRQQRVRDAEEEWRSRTVLEARKRFDQAKLEAQKRREGEQQQPQENEQEENQSTSASSQHSANSEGIDEASIESFGNKHNGSAHHTIGIPITSNSSPSSKSDDTNASQNDSSNGNGTQNEQEYIMKTFTIDSCEESLESVHLDAKSVESMIKNTATSMAKLTNIFYSSGGIGAASASTMSQLPEDDKRSEGSDTARNHRGGHQEDHVRREEVPSSPYRCSIPKHESDSSAEAWIDTAHKDEEEDSLSTISDSSIESMPFDCFMQDECPLEQEGDGDAQKTALSRLLMDLEDTPYLHQGDNRHDHDPTRLILQIHDYCDRPLRECYAPPGNLGLTFRPCQKGGLPVVSRINRNSPLHGFILEGESILAIADEPTEGLSAKDLTNLLKKGTVGTRKLTVLGMESPSNS